MEREMLTDDEDVFANLQHDLRPTSTAKPAVKHPCGQCFGTGTWTGGVNRHGNRKCFACNGRGHFKTSHADRVKARDQRRASKARKLADTQQAFEEANPGLMAALIKIADWNSFAMNMAQAYAKYGALTERQVTACQNMLAKLEARNAEREAEKARNSVDVDLSAIRAMFTTALENGLKKPTYRAEGLVISMAGANSRNAGSLYVKTVDGDYQGKITPEHKFHASREAAETTNPVLLKIAEDPRAAAVRYGRELGNCSCCGRMLTNKDSIEAGIGPICASRFGF